MMHAGFLSEIFAAHRDQCALIWDDREVRYGDLLQMWQQSHDLLTAHSIGEGAVVALEADFTPRSVAMLLALIDRSAIVVPLAPVAEVGFRLKLTDEVFEMEATGRTAVHPLLRGLSDARRPGLVVFSSATTGKSKAALHDFVPLLEKYKVPRRARRMLSFLLFDHLGGLNTLFFSLSNAGTLLLPKDRTPNAIGRAIARHRIQVLPATPTFLNLLLISEAHAQSDLSSLELITYGTEPMPHSLLERLRQVFSKVEFQQTYGLTELGVLRSKSKSSESLWVKLGGPEFETRVRDGKLEIRARSAMVGYLNAPSPFTEDGWYMTGDLVETDGEYLRILGRDSNLINVGGQKVYPIEVESALLRMPQVGEAVVFGESNAILGQIVTAMVRLTSAETAPEFRVRMRQHLHEQGLPDFMVPQKVRVSAEPLHSERFKIRRTAGQA
jgi:acyl-coenzyme A synthetase/AMP-(fatty) acid ligase